MFCSADIISVWKALLLIYTDEMPMKFKFMQISSYACSFYFSNWLVKYIFILNALVNIFFILNGASRDTGLALTLSKLRVILLIHIF